MNNPEASSAPQPQPRFERFPITTDVEVVKWLDDIAVGNDHYATYYLDAAKEIEAHTGRYHDGFNISKHDDLLTLIAAIAEKVQDGLIEEATATGDPIPKTEDGDPIHDVSEADILLTAAEFSPIGYGEDHPRGIELSMLHEDLDRAVQARLASPPQRG